MLRWWPQQGGVMAVIIPVRLRDEDFATCLVQRYRGRNLDLAVQVRAADP
jgi:hypothetical protein